ncbi:MAG: cytochrome c, partial [Methylibium sp.]|nr:cytochrome c [Methylibium sp.]
ASPRGAAIYTQHCAQCHGDRGEGGLGAPRALAGNRAVTLDTPANLIRVLLLGGYVPATAGNPRPHGMPPFVQTLSDEEIAAVLTYLRGAWGHQAAPVSTLDMLQSRQGP